MSTSVKNYFATSSPSVGATVAEVPGLYGSFTFSEKLLQRIWARGEFEGAAARTADGRTVKILTPGKWNGLGGPDFLGARLRLDGMEMTGDIELHLHVGDWAAHAHARDPAYADVMLHVVLFPSEEIFTAGAGGRHIPVLALLPLLQRGLEEYAEDAAVEAFAGRPLARVPAELAALDASTLKDLLARHAARRWQQKIHFARQRVAKLGWEEACHHTALEILGHRSNRAPMLAVAAQFPLAAWAAGGVDLAAVWTSQDGRWQSRGVRPLNHPRWRLRQYAAWMVARPDWPARLRALAKTLPVPSGASVVETRAVRRKFGLPAWRAKLSSALCADAVRGTRFDTLVCDGFLPLLAAADKKGGLEVNNGLPVRSERAEISRATPEDRDAPELGGLWQIWFPGDLPATLLPTLRVLGVFAAPARPACQGAAQGLLGWLLETGKY